LVAFFLQKTPVRGTHSIVLALPTCDLRLYKTHWASRLCRPGAGSRARQQQYSHGVRAASLVRYHCKRIQSRSRTVTQQRPALLTLLLPLPRAFSHTWSRAFFRAEGRRRRQRAQSIAMATRGPRKSRQLVVLGARGVGALRWRGAARSATCVPRHSNVPVCVAAAAQGSPRR
jgi:hypothetical protein